MVVRASDSVGTAICKACISHLMEKAAYDKTIFKTVPCATDVHHLYKVAAQGEYDKIAQEGDLNVVAGVLQYSLKQMRFSPTYEIYGELTNLEIVEEEELNVKHLSDLFAKLPHDHFYLMRSICSLLHKLASTTSNSTAFSRTSSVSSGNFGSLGFMGSVSGTFNKSNNQLNVQDGDDAPFAQVTTALGPYMCRLPDAETSFMSLRHISDLTFLRPVIEFLVEHYAQVFRGIQPLAPPPDTSAGSVEGLAPSSSNPLLKTRLHSSIVVDETTVESSAEDSAAADKPSNIDFNSWEWKVFESLVSHSVSSFLHDSASLPTAGKPCAVPAVTAVVGSSAGPLSWDDNEDEEDATLTEDFVRNPEETVENVEHWDDDSARPSDASSGRGSVSVSLETSATQSNMSHSVRRRQMVVECKKLRSQIYRFEEEWMALHGRAPKGAERGKLSSVYNEYRNMKKTIRNMAAIYLQKHFRGILARRRQHYFVMQNRSSTKSIEDVTIVYTLQKGSSVAATSTSTNVPSATSTAPKPAGDSAAFPPIPLDIYTRFMEMSAEKRELKRTLKKFDDDFLLRNNRNPSKADKEVMRPLYQKYHDAKSAVDMLRGTIEKTYGPLPGPMSAPSIETEGTSTKESTDRLFEDRVFNQVDEGNQSIEVTPAPASGKSDPSSGQSTAMNALVEEKRTLHAYLKNYERVFNKNNGRPVTRQEDIQPVAAEYQRYKELKVLVNDISKASS